LSRLKGGDAGRRFFDGSTRRTTLTELKAVIPRASILGLGTQAPAPLAPAGSCPGRLRYSGAKQELVRA
jgi:hypothetical protein